MYFYDLYRNLHIEWLCLLFILSCGLFACFSSEKRRLYHFAYAGANVLTMALMMPFFDRIPFVKTFETQGSAIWTFFLEIIIASLIWVILLFRADLKEASVYIVFYNAFILAFKTAMGPFYSMEQRMDPGVYAVIDLVTIVLLQLLAGLMVYLFNRSRFYMEGGVFTLAYKMGTLIPMGVLLVMVLSASGVSYIWANTAQILSLVIVVLLPLYYYIMSSSMRGVKERYELEGALSQTKAQLSRYRYSLELEDRIRKERHELKNNYLYIQALLSEGRTDELKTYLDRLIGERMDAISSIFTGNVLLDYILNRKIADAKKRGIPISVDVILGKNTKVNEESFCTILLNLLDNAIEASIAEQEPGIMVSIREVGGYMILIVKNRVSYDVLAQNPGLHTTKADGSGHGHGIAIIKKAAADSDGMFDIKLEDGFFTATAGLPISRL